MPDNVSHERTALLQALTAPRSSTRRASRAPTARSRWRRSWRPRTRASSCPTSTATTATRAPTTRRTGPEILRDLPEIDVFVAGLGTGGTLTGTGRYLKEHKPGVKIIAAAPHPGDLVQGLRSLEDGFIPPVLDQTLLDGRIVVDSRNSFAATKELMEKEGIFAGISGGAVLRTAQRVGRSAWSTATSSCCWPTAAGSTSRPTSGTRLLRPRGRRRREDLVVDR